ncbi:hypothetical protein Aperf_G00000109130 [Anoplocephala perfoliata]
MSVFLTSCFTGNFGKNNAPLLEEIYEFSPVGRALHRSSEHFGSVDSSGSFFDRRLGKWEKQRRFKWYRLGDEGIQNRSIWSRIARFLRLERVDIISHSLHQKTNSVERNRSNCDGYVNHGFSDTPVFIPDRQNQIPPPPPPIAQIAKFRSDLANFKSDLIHLQEVLVANNATESGVTQSVSECTLSQPIN